MHFIEKDNYSCPYCGCGVKREELCNPPELKCAISERNNIKCPSCGHRGMNYMTNDFKLITYGKDGYGMFGCIMSNTMN